MNATLAPAPRRRRATGWVFALIALIGVGGIAYAWWALYGTTILAENAADERLAEFAAQAPPAPDAGSQWHTSLDDIPQLDPAASDTASAFAVLHVPAWKGLTRGSMPIMEGTSDRILDQAAAGHYKPTAGPGQIGNFALAAHRRTKGNSFRHLPDLKEGDLVIVETPEVWLRYQITTHEIVRPDDGAPLFPVPGNPNAAPTQRLITLSTCTGPDGSEWSNSRRWMTHGELTGWMPRTEGVPSELGALGRP